MSTLEPAKKELMRRAFPPALIGKLPRTEKRPALDYVGHAAVTDRLQAVDEDWTFTIDREFEHGAEFWIRGTLTVGGVSRPEYGSGPNPLEAVSHFIRRAAMRFGIALDLWSKEELASAELEPRTVTSPGPEPTQHGEPAGMGEADGEGEGDHSFQGEVAVQPSSSPPKKSDAQRWMEEFHPGKPHKMELAPVETTPRFKICKQKTIGDADCPYAEEAK